MKRKLPRTSTLVQPISKKESHCEGAKRLTQSPEVWEKARLLRQKTARNDIDLGFLRWFLTRCLTFKKHARKILDYIEHVVAQQNRADDSGGIFS